MKRKFLLRVLCVALTSCMMMGGMTIPANAQTLAEAGLTEETRGYGGNGNQNKSRTREITMKVTVGAGGTDASWTGLAELTPYIANDEVEMLNREVTFGDLDSDGDIDSTDLFRKLEEYKRGDVAFGCTSSDYGDFYTSLFGIDAGGSFTYWINGNYCTAGTPDLYDNDNLTLVVFTGDYNAWGSIDDSAYDGHKSATTYTSLEDVLAAGVITPTDPEPTTPDPVTPIERQTYTKYLALVDQSLEKGFTSTTTGTGMWQQLRIARFANGSDKTAFANYATWYAQNNGVVLGKSATDDMRVLSVVNNETAINNLLYGPGNTIDDVEDSSDAFVYDKKAGMYAMDYILMALDLIGAGLEDDDLTNKLSDYTVTVSVRDDLVYQILNTAGCWGGNWFTYDTGCQNAQSLVPYYNRYSEVKVKLDEFEATAYAHFIDEAYTGSSFDASSAGEYVRFAAILSKEAGNITFEQHALDVYNKIETIGIENTKYKGNTMDVWRMATAEWGLNSLVETTVTPDPVTPVDPEPTDPVEPEETTELRMYVEEASAGLSNEVTCHLQANKDINDAVLFEAEIEIPAGVTITSVDSDVADITFGIQDNILRLVIAELETGSKLSVLKDHDLFDFTFTVKEAGDVKFVIRKAIFRLSSEESREANINIESMSIHEPLSATAEVLYTGAKTSRFISEDLQAVKVTLTTDRDIDGTLQYKVGEEYYNLYLAPDFKANESVKVYVTLLPKTVTVKELENLDNYYTVEADSPVVTFGNVNGDDKVNSADALWVVQLWVGKIPTYTYSQTLAANVTKDSDIDNSDTLSIVEFATQGTQFKILR